MKIPRIIASNPVDTGHYSKFNEMTRGPSLSPSFSESRARFILVQGPRRILSRIDAVSTFPPCPAAMPNVAV